MSSTNDRAPDPRPARTRAAIFTAARDLTASDGEVTVNALAKRAGVSRAAFYSHFSGLDDLMGAMLQQMFDTAWVRGVEYGAEGRGIHHAVRFGFGMLVAYIERHHAFLRGALDWKFSHRTYMDLVNTMAAIHSDGMRHFREDLLARVDVESAGRSIAGGALALGVQWLLETEEQAKQGQALDATALLETILQNAPAWYTGLDPEETVGAGELLEICRRAEPAAAPGASGASGA